MNKRHLPPLNALRIFETAARASSLSAAARELGITHGAVSRQIKMLEEWPLFTRQGQRNIATEHAQAFAAEISAAFDLMGDAAVRFGRTPSTRVIKVNTQTTFAMRWLIPRLPAFHALYPDIEVSVATSNSTETKSLPAFDVLIRRDPLERPEWRHFAKRPLFEEKLSQVFVSAHTRVGEWERWLQAAGIADLRPQRFQRFDHYHVALQAIVDGLGVGIGGLPTLANDLKAGRLVAPCAITVKGSKYAAWIPPDVDKSQALNHFLDWLELQAAAE